MPGLVQSTIPRTLPERIALLRLDTDHYESTYHELQHLYPRLAPNGVLDLVFEEPRDTKFVVSPNAPVRQIWISAMSRSYKLAWDHERGSFALNGESLTDLLGRLTREFLDQRS